MNTGIYLDHSATTPLRHEALEAMQPFLQEEYGNPSAIYQIAVRAKEVISECRRTIASTLHGEPEEILFTSGGTESDNWALRGIVIPFLLRHEKVHIISTQVEHHAVLRTLQYLEKLGASVTLLPVDQEGFVRTEDVERAIRPETRLISVMTANNEIGTIEPVAEIGKIARERGIVFHTDAVQAYGHIPLDVQKMNIDLLSVSSHKFGGPKGTGFLFVRSHTDLENLMFGGDQERGMRAGTENVAGIVGMAAAARLSCAEMKEEAARERNLTHWFYEILKNEIPDMEVNGPAIGSQLRLPNHMNFLFPGVLGESLLMLLDLEGIAASAGSACSAGALEPSHVLTAIGRTEGETRSSLRFTLGRENTREELERTAEILQSCLRKLRR